MCGVVSDEQGERFHQDMKEMERRYQGRWRAAVEQSVESSAPDRRSLNIHFLNSHLDFLTKNFGDVRNEHDEMFHQDIAAKERSYHGRWDESMLADYYWTVIRDSQTSTYERQSKKKCSQEIN